MGVVAVSIYSNQFSVEWFISVASQIRDSLLVTAQQSDGKQGNRRPREQDKHASKMVYSKRRKLTLSFI